MHILLVGGAVRDLLLGNEVGDRDFLVLGCSEENFRERFPRARKIGKSFPVYKLGRSEIAFPRAHTLERDLAARDLTINAVALDEHGNLYLHPDALEDLHNRVLRPASGDSFEQDPLRVFRCARLFACLEGFTPHEQMLDLMQQSASKEQFTEILPERVGGEVIKAMQCSRPGDFLRLLERAGCLEYWFQELYSTESIPAGPQGFHDCSVFEHTCRVMDRLSGNSLRVWMGLGHDLGKKGTDASILPHHYGHEKRGEHLADCLAKRLKLPDRYRKAGKIAARYHMQGHRYLELRPGTRVDLLMRLHSGNIFTEFFQVIKADNGRNVEESARKDLQRILDVNLPPEDRDQGPESGKKLRDLRSQALSGT